MDHAPVVQMLLEAGADVNAQHLDGTSALSEAVRYRHEEVIQMLLDAGAK